ncbi:putative inactive 1-aminocyclopropane-1-carboxylate synthase-like protein 2 [Ceratocystis platani]|uniref:Putative inactive 1-aminocyclopropane-1-carboxylate synthase-like protein 2 n=1 Tax=Ceratocystis fimbriata f. sp. platani TaxID=88771 RepID=A0A0F8D911_CERFI|nr:putative inactive 1-aminocyclopropane-1-carboxylate synthase-like protein 2 [Ceratocystis platani]
MSLSKRAEPIARQTPLTKIWEVIANVWHPETNPSGFVSLGVAENSLMHDTLCDKLPAASDISTIAFTYGNGLSGSLRLRTALASFLNDKHSPATPILPAHIMLTNGCSAAIEQLSWILADPGDVWLLGQPYYGTFIPDLGLRPDAEVMPCGVLMGQANAQNTWKEQRGGEEEKKTRTMLIRMHTPMPHSRIELQKQQPRQ